jgi:prevent-host-death family protein
LRSLNHNLDFRRFYGRYSVVTTISATKARDSLYSLINEVRESHEPIQITGKQGNAVLISEEDWRSIRETLFLHSIPGMVDSIKQARTEGLAGATGKLDW